MKRSQPYIVLILIVLISTFCDSLYGQSWRKNFNRESNISMRIDKVDSFQLKLKRNDIITFNLSSSRSVNFQLRNPQGQPIYVGLSKSGNPVRWSTQIDSSGLYSVKMKSGFRFLPTDVELKINLERPNFQVPRADSLVFRKSQELMNTSIKLPRNKKGEEFTNTFSYQVYTGDTLHYKMIPLFGKTPYVDITSNDGEILFAETPKKGNVEKYVVALDTGIFNINLTSRSLLPKTDSLVIKRIMPPKLAKPKPIMVDVTTENIFFDSIPELYMDTTIYLGAIRDYINESADSIAINFEGDSTISFWSIHFGAGQEFLDGIEYYETLLASDEESTATDILAAYGLGELKKLSDQGNKEIVFRPSSSLKQFLKKPNRNNYSTITDTSGSFKLHFENKSLSVGRNVYVRVIVFRKDYELITEKVEK